MTNKLMQAAAVALLISTTAAPAFAQNANGVQNQAESTKTIKITALMNIEDGYVVRHETNAGKALNLIGASTFGDAKVQKLIDAAETGKSLTVVVRGNQIIDIL